MAWNKQYERILEQMKKNSVTNTVITGADAKNDEPDCLFYTNFSRESAVAFYEVFENFKLYYTSNSSIAVEKLKSNLKSQIDEMGNICPIEVILYASRIIRDKLNDKPIKQALVSTIQQYIPRNLKSVQYILSGWEWPQILVVVIEACGKTNNDYAIKTAMDYCAKLAKKFVDKNDTEVLKSYITMIEYTQNENYLNYITQIATVPQFEENEALVNYLVKELNKNSFLKENSDLISKNIHAKANNYYLKNSLEKIMKNVWPNSSTNIFNMNGLSYERKVKQIETMDFSRNTYKMLRDFENLKADNETVLLICKHILNDIPKMRPSDRINALILVGTKGSRIRATELKESILELQKSNQELKVASMIALTELDSQNFTLGNTMEQLIADDNIDDWYLAIGKYFRYRKSYFREDLMRVFFEKIPYVSKNDMPVLLEKLLKLIEAFNGGVSHDSLSTDTETQMAIIELLKTVEETPLTDVSCEKLISILKVMLSFCPNEVLTLLDSLKKIAENNCYDKIIARVNEVIKKGDSAREPE